MGKKLRSQRQEQLQFSADLRSRGHTWAQVADAFRTRYRVNSRTAFRLARGWSQREAADRWNSRWPTDPKTFKNISYWETWPAPSGYEPSLGVLAKLAELYECSVADLLADAPSFRSHDNAQKVQRNLQMLPGLAEGRVATVEDNGKVEEAPALTELADQLEAIDVNEISRTAAAWMDRIEPQAIDRRQLLLKLAAGLSVAAGAPQFASQAPVTTPNVESAGRLEGIWLSTYIYHSSSRGEDFRGTHYLVLRRDGRRLSGESLPHTTGSKLRMDLSAEGSVVTGTWTEQTSPEGHYRGTTYHGTVQMIVDPPGLAMNGQWVGFGKNFKVNNGAWDLTLVDRGLSRNALQEYELAV